MDEIESLSDKVGQEIRSTSTEYAWLNTVSPRDPTIVTAVVPYQLGFPGVDTCLCLPNNDEDIGPTTYKFGD